MMMETTLSRSMRLMFSGSVALGLGMMAQQAFAQEAAPDAAAAQPVQRVEITGSAIKRIVKEGALPVQVLTAEDIKKTGATSATDLIQNLPAMQGFVAASASVNGGGGGQTTAALHSLPSKYTLVLLDGQRVATQGNSVNLESIPLDAVERVEILTDGASALYGSDAIAGVVNFILKKNKTDGDFYVTGQDPQHPGGRSWSAGISKGFGDLDKDGYNFLATYSHDVQNALEATQRSFSKQGGFFNFAQNGTAYTFDARSYNHAPANLIMTASPIATPNVPATVGVYDNPYFDKYGNCGPNPHSTTSGGLCLFNYAATVQDIPSSKRDSGLLKGTFKINDNTTAWATLMLSKYDMTAQYAPSAQPFGISPTSHPNLWTTYVLPALAAQGATINDTNGGSATAYFRTIGNGGRTDDYGTDARHFSAGITSSIGSWDVNATLTLSNSVAKDTAAGGYGDFNLFNAAVDSGAYDPFMNTGVAALNSTQITGQLLNKNTSNADDLKIGAQHDLFAMAGGTSIVSLGAEFTSNHVNTQYGQLELASSGYSTQPAGAAGQDAIVGGSAAQVPADYKRKNEGLSAEVLLPVTNTLEGTVAGRYDSYDKVTSGYVFDSVSGQQLPNADLGNTFSKATYKLSLRWTPVDTLLVRGSYGTGFKAPAMGDIAGTQTFAGSTAGSYACPFPGSSGCGPLAAQYDLLSGGNPFSGDKGLKAENSKQWTVGFRVEPGLGLSVGADLWNVQITNQVLAAGIPEQVGFNAPQQYSYLFVNPYTDPVGKYSTIAFEEVPLNGGVANYQGIDWDVTQKLKTPVGPLNLAWAGTYMMKQNYTFSQGGKVLTDLGQYGPDQSVVFRVQMHAMASLTTGKFTNTLAANYKSGYKDESYTAAQCDVVFQNADGSEGNCADFAGLHVGSYTTFDWQGRFDYSKSLNFTAGIKNVFDRNPPLTLQNGGGGNQVGYDGRYVDAIGRAFYVSGHYKF